MGVLNHTALMVAVGCAGADISGPFTKQPDADLTTLFFNFVNSSAVSRDAAVDCDGVPSKNSNDWWAVE